ncbi:hypothetical protein LIER_21876 [Lithospermum erythrorhizon]|uniref:Uncharacterized protein n=1 Tax=Lithospermum erythrorhizon TaxID=34254 RepID=A0AAV3QRS5_LITER
MEIPDVSMISDFQAGVNCLQNPSIISRLFTLLGMELWKWSAIILAVFAAFKRLKVLFIRFRGTVAPSLEKIVEHLVEDFELTDDDDEDDEDECSSVSTLEDFSEEEEEEIQEDYIKEKGKNGNQLRLLRKLSWIDFSNDSSVVKLWDGFEESYRNIVSMWDSSTIFDLGNQYQVDTTFVVAQPPTVTLTAEVNRKRNGVVLNAYDRRMRGEKSVVIADWPQYGVEKVNVRNGINGVLTVGDLRNTKTPLKTVRLRGSNGDEFGNDE